MLFFITHSINNHPYPAYTLLLHTIVLLKSGGNNEENCPNTKDLAFFSNHLCQPHVTTYWCLTKYQQSSAFSLLENCNLHNFHFLFHIIYENQMLVPLYTLKEQSIIIKNDEFKKLLFWNFKKKNSLPYFLLFFRIWISTLILYYDV